MAVPEVQIEDAQVGIEPEECYIPVDDTCDFNISLTPIKSAKLGNKTGKFRVRIKRIEDVEDEITFILTVLPDEEKKAELNQSLSDLNITLHNLSQRYQQIRERLNQSDRNNIERLLNYSLEYLSNAKSAMDSGNWIEMEKNLDQLNSTLQMIQSRLEGVKVAETGFGDIWLWAVIGAIIVGFAGFIVYLFLPPKPGYHPKYGYRPKKEKPHLRAKRVLKEAHERIREGARKLKKKREGKFRYSYKS